MIMIMMMMMMIMIMMIVRIIDESESTVTFTNKECAFVKLVHNVEQTLHEQKVII